MTRTTNARLAGAAFLLYIAVGIAGMAIRQVPGASDIVAQLTSLFALVLGVTLYALTRDQDRDIAMLGLACRVIEAAPGDGALFFAIGSALFAWLLLRGRMVPAPLGWLGLVASLLLVLILPLQQAGWFGGPMNWSSLATWIAWLPMLIYEVTLGLWLLVRGAAMPAPRPAG